MAHKFYSQREGTNPNLKGLPLIDTLDLFCRVFNQLREDGYFDEAFGYSCVDAGFIEGKVKNIELEILLSIRKKDLWPIHECRENYTEDDFLDIIEFLFQNVSKPIDGNYHNYSQCGMHWEIFNKAQGQSYYCSRVNEVLDHYKKPYEIAFTGEVIHKPEEGFEQIFTADIPTSDNNVTSRVNSAILQFRRHGSSHDERRQAVRDLADVLEYLRPQMKALLTSADENDLFNIANNFGIRHHNLKQKTQYDSLWLNWMFYVYLATIHVILRKIQFFAKG
jgi:hypothetical protein